MNPLSESPTAARDQITEPCVCHDAAHCPDQVTVTVGVAELARLGALLSEVDEFLRCGNGAAESLADFYARRGDPHPRFAAANLIDAVGLAALTARRLIPADDKQAGGRS